MSSTCGHRWLREDVVNNTRFIGRCQLHRPRSARVDSASNNLPLAAPALLRRVYRGQSISRIRRTIIAPGRSISSTPALLALPPSPRTLFPLAEKSHHHLPFSRLSAPLQKRASPPCCDLLGFAFMGRGLHGFFAVSLEKNVLSCLSGVSGSPENASLGP